MVLAFLNSVIMSSVAHSIVTGGTGCRITTPGGGAAESGCLEFTIIYVILASLFMWLICFLNKR